MSQQALQRAETFGGADLAQRLVVRTEIGAEAERLAALAGQFGLFGLALAPPPQSQAVAQTETTSAHVAYLDAGPAPAPANVDGEFEVEPDTAEPVGAYLARIVAEAPALTPAPTKRAPHAFPALAPRGPRLSARHAMRAMQMLDWAAALGAAQVAALWSNGVGLAALTVAQAIVFLFAAGALKAGFWLTDLYRTPPHKLRPEHGAGGLALGVIAGLIIAAAFAPSARAAAALSATLPLAALLLAGAHAGFAFWIGRLHRRGAFCETIVLVGATEAAERLAQRAAARGDARIVAVVDDRHSRTPHSVAGAPVTGSIDELLRWEGLPHVDRIVVTVTQKAEGRVRSIIEKLRVAPNRIDLLLDYDTVSVRGRRLDRLTGAAMACVSGRPHDHGRALAKRAQDIVLSLVLIAAFAPVMAAVALAVKLDSKGPVLYRQRRHGFNNRIITVFKFRSMKHDPSAPLKQVTAKDPRVTRIGAFLRSTSLDELPQLFNVLWGDMSLVGPRPHAVGMRSADRDLGHIVAEYAHRHRVKPGITGWAQINGSRGPVETPALVRERVRLDLEYISRANLWLDLAILIRTLPALLGDRKATR